MQNEPLLIFIDEPERAQIPIYEGVTRIGRGADNDVIIDTTGISKVHCALVRQNSETRVFDFGSRNGTHVGKYKAEGQVLRDGDELRLGKSRIVYMDSGIGSKAAPEHTELRQLRKPWMTFVGLAVGFCMGLLSFWGISIDTDSQENEQQQVWQQQELSLTMRIRSLEKELDKSLQALQALDEERKEREHLAAEELRLVLEETQNQLRKIGRERDMLAEQLRVLREQEELAAEEQKLQKQTEQEIIDALEQEEQQQTPEDNPATKEQTVVDDSPQQKSPREKKNIEKALSIEELDALAKRLTGVIENYATPSISTAYLEPALSSLVSVNSEAAAERLLQVYRHARELLEDLDGNLEFLEKRNRNLLRMAERSSGLSSKKAESNQRLIELSSKKIAIQKGQRQRLLALRDALLTEIHRFHGKEVLSFLAQRFKKDDDAIQNRVIVEVLADNRAVSAVPMLIDKLSVRDESLQQAIQKALAKITGVNYGNDRQQWRQWWEKRQNSR